MSDKKQKEKKEKVKYIDDGRSIADMSSLGPRHMSSGKGRPRSTFKERWQTYWMAVRMMILPTIVVLGILALTYLIMYLALTAAR